MGDIKQFLLKYGPQIIGVLVFVITACTTSVWRGNLSKKALSEGEGR